MKKNIVGPPPPPPLKKGWGNLVKTEEKNESRSKLHEMAKKLGNNCFWNF